jgi:hypothetical protein
MGSGPYDDPSYLTRQAISLTNAAGANGTSGYKSFISDMRFRKASVTVRTAGTSSGAGNQAILLAIGTYLTGYSTGAIGTGLTTTTGTNTVGVISTLGSSAAGAVTTSTDFNFTLLAGGVIALKNGTDATGVYDVTLEGYLNPLASWTGQE